jgi:putative methionine-R-sulfoxide reductase with GAF domain
LAAHIFTSECPIRHGADCQAAPREDAAIQLGGLLSIDPIDPNFLIVRPFAGSFTPNTRIRLTDGLCGLAATSKRVVVVQEVSKDPRYLAGSSMVKSEIVVPIFVRKKLAAELDIERLAETR